MDIKRLKLAVDPKSEIPLYVQLKNQLRYLIQNKILAPGEQLPTVRELAVELSITANTVARVYTDLESEGLVYSIQGKGTFVSERAESKAKKDNREHAREIVSGTIRSLRGLGLADFEIRKLLMDIAENIDQY